MSCQKGVTQEWMSILIWNFLEMIREMINWPKTQYLHATTTTNTATISTITTTTTVNTTTTSVARTNKAENTEKIYKEMLRGKLN